MYCSHLIRVNAHLKIITKPSYIEYIYVPASGGGTSRMTKAGYIEIKTKQNKNTTKISKKINSHSK